MLFFFLNPEHHPVLERMMPGEQSTAQLELGQSLTKLTCLRARRTIILPWKRKLSQSVLFLERKGVMYLTINLISIKIICKSSACTVVRR